MKIFIDLDQVLVNFLGGCRKVLGKEFNDPSLGSDKEKWCFLSSIPNFWLNLDWMPGARQLWDRIKDKDSYILSACPRLEDNPNCAAEKTAWCEQLGIESNRVFICRRRDKKNFAMTDGMPNLLIDDHPKNVSEWIAAGGIAILHLCASETIGKLIEMGY